MTPIVGTGEKYKQESHHVTVICSWVLEPREASSVKQRMTEGVRKAVKNSVSGQADRCKALEAHPPFEKGKQVSIPLHVRAATRTLHSLCGKGLLIN